MFESHTEILKTYSWLSFQVTFLVMLRRLCPVSGIELEFILHKENTLATVLSRKIEINAIWFEFQRMYFILKE